MKQNSCAVIRKAPKAPCVGFDQLNGAIEAFSASVADLVFAVGKQARLVSPEHLDHIFDRLNATAHRMPTPSVKPFLSTGCVGVAPELREVFLDRPSPAGFEIELVQSPKRDSFTAAPIAVPSEPVVFTALERGIPRTAELSVFFPACLIHRITQILADMKAVMHDVCLGQDGLGRTHEGGPHVHGNGLHRLSLLLAQSLQQRTGRLQSAPGHNIQDAPLIDVGQDAGIAVTALGALLIQAQMFDGLRLSGQQTALNGFEHDGIDAAPRQAGESAHAFGAGALLQELEHERLHQMRDAGVAISPRGGQLLHAAIGVFDLGDAGADDGLKLAGVQMPPLALAPAVDMGSGGGAGGISPDLAFFEGKVHRNALRLNGHVHRLNHPRRLDAQQMFVKRCVFHVRSPRLAQNRILFHCGKLEMRVGA
jgi:hypothetical protein